MSMSLLTSTLWQGLLWGILALGVFLTYRVLDVADLTVEGSYPLGAAVGVSYIAGGGSPVMAVVLAFLAGSVAGVVTGLLHTKLKIPALLAGILTMIGLYSINIRVMGDKSNVSILRMDTIYTFFENFGLGKNESILVCGLIFVVTLIVFLYWFFGTEIGAAIRATGCNKQMIRAQGVDTDITIILGLLISNGMVAMAGALIGQSQGFADVGMGTGTIVIGLASVIIGEVLFGTRNFMNWLLAVVGGSIVYRVVIAAVLKMGMNQNDMKLLTASIVVIALAMPLIKEKIKNAKGA
ncbi:MAG: ABC transporter permease [Peptococcaceae bacterium]|jgi:putative ABC transport system permease protein|nr:ABC transporter permease [Peptococcaceae bacterium]MBQ2014438.1 ABC transporter permease [Peptococcaceae bacterium]MBQ2034780.1 ABC transporter permease [Peptococcaceae bacterium]MBQ2120062.1 ABC transporter permease [Peptococcaceae bacterium]MBQ2448612.1 ABC transporter permease [Peptococcaceae bacterium]